MKIKKSHFYLSFIAIAIVGILSSHLMFSIANNIQTISFAESYPKEEKNIQIETEIIYNEIIKEITKETTITRATSITYHIQFGKDSFGIWILS